MTETIADQAAGLRRLLAPPALRSIAVTGASAACGYADVAANLAVALAAQGRDVVIVDADGEAGAARLLGCDHAHDLMDGVRGACTPAQIASQARPSLRLVRAGRFFAGFDELRPTDAGNLAELMAAVCRDADVLLMVAAPATRPALATADTLLVVTLDDTDSLTRTYRVLKRSAADARRQQRAAVLLNRAQSKARGDRIFGNLVATSARFLSLPLECMGNIPEDAHMERAAELQQPVIELFPACPAAGSLRSCADALMLMPCPDHASAHAFAARVLSTVRAAARGRH